MPLTLVRAPDSRTLWNGFIDRFLAEVGGVPGPDGLPARAWVAQESQVDLLYEAAHERGVKGWLGPPVTTLRHLAARFDIRERRLGLLTRRRLIGRLAREAASAAGMTDPSSDGVVRGHMLDALFGELLPEGVTPDELQEALAALGATDDFAARRNEWILRTYRGYLAELGRRERLDARQTSARVAERVERGDLVEVLGGARTLHVYGLYMLRSRQRLLAALARQPDVDVRVYLLAAPADEGEPDEWEDFAAKNGCATEELASDPAARAPGAIEVQPAPDTQRETEWVVRRVKRLLLEDAVEPHRIAVVARSGREDTGRVHRALRDAGVVATTIVRARLTEIAALKALLLLFRGAAAKWSYRTLRPVLDNSLLDIGIDVRTIDFIAYTRRVEGLAEWENQIERLIEKLGDTDSSGLPKDRAVRGSGLWADAVGRDLERFRVIRVALETLAAPRPESEWIELTLALLRDTHPAAFHLRRRLCDPAGEDRWDAVRLDQRGVRQTEMLLREWLDLDHPADPLEPAEWRQLLERMLEANELSLTTPVHKGVQVLEAHDAALLPFDHVFVIHANDGVFPRPIPAAGVLSNDERERLRRLRVPLSWRDLELQRERALWRAVTGAGWVTVTYRTADPTGTPLLPSLLVPDHDPEDELPRTRTSLRADDERFVPVTPAQADERAALALHKRLAGSPPGTGPDQAPSLPGLHPGSPDLLPHAVLAAVAEAHRDTGPVPPTEESPALRPNPWNGWLRDPRVQAKLAKRFGEDHRWSPSRLESYSKLPFQFLLDHVLRYEEGIEAEEEVTPLVFGSTAHDLLEAFYRRVKDDLPPTFDSRAESAFEAACDDALAAARERDSWLGSELLWEPEWRKIRESVRTFLTWELEHLAAKNEHPELIEQQFGFGDDAVYIEGKDAQGRPARLRLCGRIDRVDRGKKGYQVLDYKSGAMPGANDYEDGTALQAPLYMQVLENEGRNVSLGYYRSLKKTTQYGGKIDRTKPNYVAALRFALSVPGRIRAGLFEPVASRKSKGWAPWHAGREVGRSQATLGDCNRYEDIEPVQPEPAPADAALLAPPTVDDAALQAPPPAVDDAPASVADARPDPPVAEAAADGGSVQGLLFGPPPVSDAVSDGDDDV